MYKVIIAGSRDFNDYKLLEKKMVNFLRYKYPSQVEIVSGTAMGADKLGERFAKEKGCKLTLFPVNWEIYGRGAGHIRNAQMAEYADACVVFWDGVSKGTRSMIDLAYRANLDVKIVRF